MHRSYLHARLLQALVVEDKLPKLYHSRTWEACIVGNKDEEHLDRHIEPCQIDGNPYIMHKPQNGGRFFFDFKRYFDSRHSVFQRLGTQQQLRFLKDGSDDELSETQFFKISDIVWISAGQSRGANGSEFSHPGVLCCRKSLKMDAKVFRLPILRPKTKAQRARPGTGLDQVRLGGDSDNFAAEVKKQEDNNPLQEIHLRPYEINALKQHDVHKLSKVLEANPGDLSKVYPEPDPVKLRSARVERDKYNESKRPGPPTARTLGRNENVLRI